MTTVKETLVKALREVYPSPEVNAGQVYKGFDYDGVIQANGWWFKPFSGQGVFLGKSQAEALDTIDEIKGEK